MEAMLQNRFEGSIFFVYDRHFLQKEEDRLEDAIIYFYPHSMPIDNQCRLCGQLMGVVQFTDSVFDSYPALFRFDNEKIAVKHVGKYSFALAGNSLEPDSALLATVDRLYFLFAFYHGSIEQVELECDNDREKFIPEIRVIWEQYLAFTRNYGDNLPSVFNPIPYLPLKNDPNFYFLKASHILESCQRRPQIIAGAILYNRYILCSQLSPSISRCFLLLKPNQEHHPAVPIETDYQLPFGVRLFNVYLKRSDLRQILENNDNSPYQSQSETISSLHCCCTGHRTPRSRTPRMQVCRITPQPEATPKVDEVLTRSEKDPLSSSGNSGSKLCKAMLEDLLLRGFKCCKCIDETDGELENGSSFDDSVGSVIECMEDQIKPKKDFTHSTEDMNYNDIEEGREVGAHSRNSLLSRNSTLETESGIEVTGSDFHSSAATHLDQRCGSFRDSHMTYQEKSRNFAGHLEKGEQCNLSYKTDQFKAESYSERKKGFGLETERHEERNDYNEIGNEGKAQDCHTLNVDVTYSDYDKRTLGQANERENSDNLQNNVDCNSAVPEEKGKKQLGGNSDGTMNHNVEEQPTDHFDINVLNSAEKGTQSCNDVLNHNGNEIRNAPKHPKQLTETPDNVLNNAHVPVEIDTKQLREISDHQLNDVMEQRELFNNVDVHSAVPVEKAIKQLRQMSDVHEISDVPVEEHLKEQISHKMSNQRLDVSSTLDEQYQLSSSEDSYRTPDEILDTEEDSSEESNEINEGQWVNNGDIDTLLNKGHGGVVHVCKLGKNAEVGSLAGNESQGECSKDDRQDKHHRQCCEVDGLIHANLFVQAHSEIVLILLAKCDLYQNEDAVRSLWNTSLSQLGELDILMKNSAKKTHQDAQVPFNLLIYDNFEKTMSGNLREPVYAPDHVFCETVKTLHDHFNNALQLSDVTLRNFLSGIYGERTLSREAYFQEPVNNTSSSNLTPNISGYLAERMRECIVKDHGLPFV